MADVDELLETIAASLSGPKRVTSGSLTVEQFDIDPLKVLDFLAKKQAQANVNGGIRLQKLISPGTV